MTPPRRPANPRSKALLDEDLEAALGPDTGAPEDDAWDEADDESDDALAFDELDGDGDDGDGDDDWDEDDAEEDTDDDGTWDEDALLALDNGDLEPEERAPTTAAWRRVSPAPSEVPPRFPPLRPAPKGPPRPLEPAVRQLLKLAVKAMLDKKARDLSVLDVAGRTSYTDAFVLCSAAGGRQVRAIANHVVARAQKAGLRPKIEGATAARWVLVDLGDAILHIFDEPIRDYYDLDSLWEDATSVPLGALGLDPTGKDLEAPDGAEE